MWVRVGVRVELGLGLLGVEPRPGKGVRGKVKVGVRVGWG